ncbi:MAG: carboxylesterase family protein, partial [Raoultibacter sp.]
MNIGRRSFVALAGTAFVSTTLFGCTSPSSSSKEQAPADNATQPDPLVVTTDKGVVRGALEDGVRVFRGIPFAEPPLGELRFAAPREALAWEGECACLECKEPPLQLDDGTVIGSEDCLYLNLWAPQDASAKNLPVFVFIHGGGYSQGSPSKDMHKGTRFAQDGVVQVNITYRLNGLGFFGSSELEKETGLFGNAGMLDQIAGLEWVQRNIAQFGGDPDNITIGGESAGAFSVSTLIASPRAQGLFKRAILESGNLLGQPIVAPAVPGDVEKAESMTASLMATLKAKNLSDMRALEARDIVAQSSFSMDVIHPSERYFW